MEENKISFSFRLDQDEILGVDGKILFIRGLTFDFDDDGGDCIILMREDLYHSATESYIESKRDFCKRYNYWCGQGTIIGEGEIADGEFFVNDVLEDADDFKVVKRNVKGIILSSFDIDMEHG